MTDNTSEKHPAQPECRKNHLTWLGAGNGFCFNQRSSQSNLTHDLSCLGGSYSMELGNPGHEQVKNVAFFKGTHLTFRDKINWNFEE
jgi:hypothetical protein